MSTDPKVPDDEKGHGDDDKPSLRQLLHAATGDRDAEAKALADRAPDEVTPTDAKVAVQRAHGEAGVAAPSTDSQLASAEVQVVISTGGTGISSRDSTFEAVDALIEKRLDGFGELFRMLSFEQIGASAMLSRATAGLAAGRIVVALPGSEAAVRLAMEKLLLPELGHLVQQAGK